MKDLADATPGLSTTPTHDDVVEVWDNHPNETYRRDMSHWRGHGRWPDEKWEEIGAQTYEFVRQAAATLGRDVPAGALLEWGPGGGANLAAFADRPRSLYGVDVSAKNLDECGRVLDDLHVDATFHPILLDGEPKSIVDHVGEPIELFISTAVFQHFPNADYGRDVLTTVAGLMSPGAIGCVQIRYDDGTPKYRSKHEDYFSRHVTFTSYALGEFWDLLGEVGLQPLLISGFITEVNYATFCFVDPRTMP